MSRWSVEDPTALERAVAELEAGRPAVIPTDTVYGLVARVDDPGAVATIFEWKGRPDEQVMAVLVASLAQARGLGRLTPVAQKLADAFWPGPLTIVLDQTGHRPLALGAPSATVGLRWPDAAFACALADRVGPLTATSANRHGLPTPEGAAEVMEQLGRADAVVVDGGPRRGLASTVVDARGPEPQVLRLGPISDASVRAAARG